MLIEVTKFQTFFNHLTIDLIFIIFITNSFLILSKKKHWNTVLLA